MRRIGCFVLTLLFALSPLVSLEVSVVSEAERQEAVAPVMKAVEASASPLSGLEGTLSVSITDFVKGEDTVTCSVLLSYGEKSVTEQAMVSLKGWEKELAKLLEKQLRYDILTLSPSLPSLRISSKYRFSYATGKEEKSSLRIGSVWGTYDGAGKQTGTVQVADVRSDTVVFVSRDDFTTRVGDRLGKKAGWGIDAFGAYAFSIKGMGGGLVASYAWPYPFHLSMGIEMLSTNLIASFGIGADWPLSTITDWYFLRNSTLSVDVRAGIGFNPIVVGSTSTILYRYHITPMWSVFVGGGMHYYATLRSKTVWANGYFISLGAGLSW